MAYEQKPGTGSLWPNDRKEKDSHADHRGTLVLPDGTEMWIDAWLKTTKKGAEYLSLSVKPKNLQRQAPADRPERPQPPQRSRPALPQRPQSQHQTRQPAPPPEDDRPASADDDDIPF